MDLIGIFRDLFAQVPELLQPLVIAAAGAIPFVEGEGAAAIGIIGGLHPVIAIITGIVGNFACVAILVWTSASARDAVVSRHRERRSRRAEQDDDWLAGAGEAVADDPVVDLAVGLTETREDVDERKARRRTKFKQAFERYGVPGVSLLGPLLLPTQFTAVMLAASGVSRVRILFWQALAIIGWSVLVGLILTGVISVVR